MLSGGGDINTQILVELEKFKKCMDDFNACMDRSDDEKNQLQTQKKFFW